MKTFFFVVSLSITAIFSSACNTTIGVGRDMRILGETMENQAHKTYHGTEPAEPADTSGAPVY